MAARKRVSEAQVEAAAAARQAASAVMAEVGAKLGEVFARISPLAAALSGRSPVLARKVTMEEAQRIPDQLRQRQVDLFLLERLLRFLAFMFQEVRRAPAQPVRVRKSRAARITASKRSPRPR